MTYFVIFYTFYTFIHLCLHSTNLPITFPALALLCFSSNMSICENTISYKQLCSCKRITWKQKDTEMNKVSHTPPELCYSTVPICTGTESWTGVYCQQRELQDVSKDQQIHPSSDKPCAPTGRLYLHIPQPSPLQGSVHSAEWNWIPD